MKKYYVIRERNSITEKVFNGTFEEAKKLLINEFDDLQECENLEDLIYFKKFGENEYNYLLVNKKEYDNAN